MDGAYQCTRCGNWYRDCECSPIGAPAQEEKEMGHCTKHQMRYGQGETCFSCTADLRERWDRAYFAALTGTCMNPQITNYAAAVTEASCVATETIRRHADMMASRDAIIAEVVG